MVKMLDWQNREQEVTIHHKECENLCVQYYFLISGVESEVLKFQHRGTNMICYALQTLDPKKFSGQVNYCFEFRDETDRPRNHYANSLEFDSGPYLFSTQCDNIHTWVKNNSHMKLQEMTNNLCGR